jgi:chemotaxis protein methyltransferase CheR
MSDFSAALELLQTTAVPGLIETAEFEFLRGLAHRHAGIVLADHKRSMVHRRVSRRVSALGLGSFIEYCDFLKGPDGGHELQPLINALTTNKTEFFRENHHFDHLVGSAIPSLLGANRSDSNRRFRIWSAGCSLGHEPYSISISLHNNTPDLLRGNTRILATDIDTDVLERARSGRYREEDLESVPSNYRASYFSRDTDAAGFFRVSPSVAAQIAFKQLNLHDQWPMNGPFDVIFCRNVIIYFDKPTQTRLIDRFAEILRPDGFLYLGHSESLYRVSERFRPVGQSIYQKIL